MTKILLLSDTHCGNVVGVCADKNIKTAFPDADKIRNELTAWFMKTKAPSYDYMLFAGDAVDGPGYKDNRFHISTDMRVQIDMASKFIARCNAEKIFMVYGTPYHVSGSMDYEEAVADNIGADIQDTQKLCIDGVKFHMRHVVGKTSTPVGGDIALRKAEHFAFVESPESPPDVIVRGHIHEARYVGNPGTLALSLPALEIPHPKYNVYGRRIHGGYVHCGFAEIVLDKGAIVSWEYKIYNFKVQGGYREV